MKPIVRLVPFLAVLSACATVASRPASHAPATTTERASSPSAESAPSGRPPLYAAVAPEIVAASSAVQVTEQDCPQMQQAAEIERANPRDHASIANVYVSVFRQHRDCPDLDKVLYRAAAHFRRANLVGRAIKVAAVLIEHYPDSPLAARAVYEMAVDYHNLGEFSHAAEHYSKYARDVASLCAGSDCPSAEAALQRAAVLRFTLGELEQARSDAEMYALRFPRGAGRDSLERARANAERCGPDASACGRHLTGDAAVIEPPYAQPAPNANAACRELVGQGLARLPDLAAAESDWAGAVARDAKCESAYVDLALVQRKRASSKEALNNLRRALATNAQSREGLLGLASLHLDEADADGGKNLGLAELTLLLALQRSGENAALYDLLGVALARRGDTKLARQCLAWSLKLDADRYSAQMNFGQLALELGASSEARVAFERAVQLRPDDNAAAEKLKLARSK